MSSGLAILLQLVQGLGVHAQMLRSETNQNKCAFARPYAKKACDS